MAAPHIVEATNKGRDALVFGGLSRKHTALLQAATQQPPMSIQAAIRFCRKQRSVAFDAAELCSDLAEMQRKGLLKVHQ